jgi:hypothetical protein
MGRTMQLRTFLAFWICIARGLAVGDLDFNHFGNAFLDPTSLNGHLDDHPILFDDASDAELNFFYDNNNPWDPLAGSDTTLSMVDSTDGNFDSFAIDHHDMGSNLAFANGDEGVCVYLFVFRFWVDPLGAIYFYGIC